MAMDSKCLHFPACGGCQTLDLEYAEQLRRKEGDLRRLFGGGGGDGADASEWPGLRIDPILPSPRTEGYRHKVQLPFGLERRGPVLEATLGCYAAGSHVVVDQRECLVQDPGLSRAAWAVREWAIANRVPVYREDTGVGWLRHLLLRKGAGTGEILLGLVTNGPGTGPQGLLPDLLERCRVALAVRPGGGELVGIVQSLNTARTNVVLGGEERLWWGRPSLREKLGPFRFPVGVSTFFQVNPFQTPRLYDLAAAHVPEGAAVLDLYSGIGSIALWASRRAGSVLGIEENPASVRAAAQAASENGAANVRFLAADVADALAHPENHLAEAGLPGDAISRADAVIVDPPRKGMETQVRDALVSLRPARIVYVSCNPATLARDARAMAGAYRLRSLAPVDMFPHTRHVECVALFEAAVPGLGGQRPAIGVSRH
ncbi:MAG TPA: 23S rRNA (uracil(1939)-C(5))-methyltransferase RlmD [Fibrobacteria bacterium]|nr:23S rRNA (uracil(1939)-C(5))-methyltransferase RlmD [Fibrobacteria bacterium]